MYEACYYCMRWKVLNFLAIRSCYSHIDRYIYPGCISMQYVYAEVQRENPTFMPFLLDVRGK